MKVQILLTMNLNQYINAILRVWDAADGYVIGKLLSLRDNHVQSSDLHLEEPERIVQRQVDSPLDELICNHLRVLFYLRKNSELSY